MRELTNQELLMSVAAGVCNNTLIFVPAVTAYLGFGSAVVSALVSDPANMMTKMGTWTGFGFLGGALLVGGYGLIQEIRNYNLNKIDS